LLTLVIRVLQDVQLGVSRQAALEAMVKRTDVAEIRHFVVALGQANRYGVPIVQTLRVQATDAREQRRSRAEERAQKLSVKLLFPLVFCILPSLFVVLLGPAAIRIAHLGLSGHH
jgi:tight adherence protein C